MLSNSLIFLIICAVDPYSNKERASLPRVTEKLFRGLLHLIPIWGTAIEKILFSIKDAKSETAKETQLSKISNDTSDILKLLQNGSTNKQEELLNQLFNRLFTQLKDKLKKLQFETALVDIRSIKNTKGFEVISLEQRLELISFEAEIYLKNNSVEAAKSIVDEIIKHSLFNERICDFILYYASMTNDQDLHEKYLTKYSTLNLSQKKVILKKAFWGYLRREYDKIIELLCINNAPKFTLKDELQDSSEAYFYLGVTLFDKKKYFEAEQILSIAYEKEKAPIHYYYLILSKAFPILDRRSAIFIITSEEKKILSELYVSITQDFLSDYFVSAPINLAEEYWLQRITIAIHFDKEQALQDYNNSPVDIKKQVKFKRLAADVFYFNNIFDKAIAIYLELHSQNSDIAVTVNILSSYLYCNEYDRALKFGERVNEFDNEGVIASLLIEAYSKLHSFEETIDYVGQHLTRTKYPIYIYRSLGDLYFDNSEIETAYKYFSLMIDSIPTEDFPPRILFAQHLRLKNMVDLSTKCLLPYVNYSYEAHKLFVYDAIKSSDEHYLQIADGIIKNNLVLEKDHEYWLGCKVELELNRNRPNTCIKYLAELFNLTPTSQVAFNYAKLKILLKDDDLLELANILSADKNPHFIMMAANCCYAIRDYIKAEELSLKALATYGNNFDESLYAQFLRNNLIPKPGIPDVAELMEVTSECAILLEQNSNQRWIGITSRPELHVKERDYTFADTKIYMRNDGDVIQLIGQIKDSNVKFENQNWVIKDIWELKTKAIRHCMFEYTSQVPDSTFFKMFTIDEKRPLESMLPVLAEREIYDKEMLADYNFRNKIGLPLFHISTRKGRNLIDTISYLFETPNQTFFSGEVNRFEEDKRQIILSATSIVVIYLLDLLEDFIDKYNNRLLLNKNTLKYFIDIVDNMNTEESGISMSIGVDEGKYNIRDYSKEFKQKKLKEYNSILSLLKKIRIIEINTTPEERDDKSKFIDLISLNEFENIKYAFDNSCILLTDDLFVRKTRVIYSDKTTTTNSVSFIYDSLKDNIDLLLDKIELLSKGKYTYLYNTDSLILIHKQLSTKYIIIGESSPYEKLLGIIHNSLSSPFTFQNYLVILIDFLNYLYAYSNDPRVNYLIESILRNIWKFINFYMVSPKMLGDQLVRICYNDPQKTTYFYNLLGNLNSEL